jgi:hypothetical protein
MTRSTVRRIAYFVAALATLISGVTGGLGFAAMMPADQVPGWLWALAVVPIILAASVLALLVGVFLFMARKPYGWGKLLCFCGLPWIFFSAIAWLQATVLRTTPLNPIDLGPGLCGATLLIVGFLLIVVDWGQSLGRISR